MKNYDSFMESFIIGNISSTREAVSELPKSKIFEMLNSFLEDESISLDDVKRFIRYMSYIDD